MHYFILSNNDFSGLVYELHGQPSYNFQIIWSGKQFGYSFSPILEGNEEFFRKFQLVTGLAILFGLIPVY